MNEKRNLIIEEKNIFKSILTSKYLLRFIYQTGLSDCVSFYRNSDILLEMDVVCIRLLNI